MITLSYLKLGYYCCVFIFIYLSKDWEFSIKLLDLIDIQLRLQLKYLIIISLLLLGLFI